MEWGTSPKKDLATNNATMSTKRYNSNNFSFHDPSSSSLHRHYFARLLPLALPLRLNPHLRDYNSDLDAAANTLRNRHTAS